MNISFALTTEQIRRRIKLETRRLGWENVKPGQILNGMVKCQGLKKGEHPEFITQIRVLSVRQERLNRITQDAVMREGFPHMTPRGFVRMFCDHNGCESKTKITVITFDYPWRISLQGAESLLTDLGDTIWGPSEAFVLFALERSRPELTLGSSILPVLYQTNIVFAPIPE